MKMLRAKLARAPRSASRREEIAKEKGEAQDVNFGSQIRSYVLHPYTMVKDHRTNFEIGDAQRVLDGDLDGFVRAELPAQRRARLADAPPSSRPRPTSTRSSPTASAVPGASTSPATRAARAPTRGCASRSATARWRSTSRRTSRASTSAVARRPTSEAERLAAEAHGAARTWFLTNGATQGNHALCLALAPLGAHVVVQRNSHASRGRRARALRRRAGLRRARSTTRSSAWPTASRPTRWRAALAAHARGARRAFIVSPTYYGMAADVGGLRRGRPRRRRRARRRPVVGPALRLPRRRAAERAGARRRRRAHLDAQDRRLADAERDAPRRATAPGSTPSVVARAIRLVRSTSPSSLLLASLDAARRQLAAARRAAAARDAARRSRRRARSSRRSRASAGRRARRAPGIAARPAAHRARRARHRPHRLRGGRGPAAHLRRQRRAGDPGDDRVPRRPRRAARDAPARWPATSRRSSSGSSRAGATSAIVRPPGDARNEMAVARATRSSARPRSWPSTTPSAASRASRSPATRRASRRCCRASASGGDRRLPARARRRGARLHGASDPRSRASTC